MIHCHIAFPDPLSHELAIEISFQTSVPEIDLYLPMWRPGRYEAADFAMNLNNVHASSVDGQPLPIHQFQSNGWKVDLQDCTQWSVKYTYYAHKMDAGNSFVDEEQVYINFTNCILHANEWMDEPIEVTLDLPKHYEIACSLAINDKGNLAAQNYHGLVDSPLLASDGLKTLTYKVADSVFKIVFMGSHPLNDENIVADFKAFTQSQCDIMGGFPCKEYLFLIQSLDYRHYHGVEHQRSTVLVLGPNTAESKEEYKEKLLGVASHELFHTWNVTRIRPAEMSPYAYNREINFNTGFVAEGLTTYYGDYFLKTSGVFSVEEYFKELNTLCQRHFDNFGRFRISLVDSSARLWLDGYKNIFPSNKVSIYVKGALASLILDLNIHHATNHKYALIDVVKRLFQKHTFRQGGYTWHNVLSIFDEIGGSKITQLVRTLVEDLTPIETHLQMALELVGCQLILSNHEDRFLAKTGLKVVNKQIVDIHPESPIRQIAVGDEIIAVNSAAFDSKLELENEVQLTVKRNGYTHQITTPIPSNEFAFKYQIQTAPNSTEKQAAFLQKWLNN